MEINWDAVYEDWFLVEACLKPASPLAIKIDETPLLPSLALGAAILSFDPSYILSIFAASVLQS
jgi:hypothetical protein